MIRNIQKKNGRQIVRILSTEAFCVVQFLQGTFVCLKDETTSHTLMQQSTVFNSLFNYRDCVTLLCITKTCWSVVSVSVVKRIFFSVNPVSS